MVMNFSETKVTCPLCGEFAIYVHTWRTKPTFGSCETCGYDHVCGYTSRGMIEHRRPKYLHDFEWYESAEAEEFGFGRATQAGD